MTFNPGLLTLADQETALTVLGRDEDWLMHPDFVICPDGRHKPYLFRWYLLPRREVGANVYFHVQVDDDPERPLHDHPWDNCSVILAGGYQETMADPRNGMMLTRSLLRKPGDVIFRRATEAHRLFLPLGNAYSMSLFTTGPKIRDWGFWFPTGWRPWRDVLDETPGMSTFKENA